MLLGKIEKNCDNEVFVQDPTVFPPFRLSGNFLLQCGSDEYKIFESDAPTEADIFIGLTDLENSCELTVRVEVENGPDLFFNLPNQRNGLTFYSKSIRRVTVQCQNGLGNGCRGIYGVNILLRNSKHSSLCPVSFVSDTFHLFNLDCGEIIRIFESDAAIEAGFSVTLNNSAAVQLCNLFVNAKLDDGTSLSFFIPNPQPNAFNSISFYSKILRSVTLECEGGNGDGCFGNINKKTVLRKDPNF